jgi:hypothetical protein
VTTCGVGSDNAPFYNTIAQENAYTKTNAAGAITEYMFTDHPSAPFTDVNVAGNLNPFWDLYEAYLADWDGAKGVTVYEGFLWGYTITKVAGPAAAGAPAYTYGGAGGDKFEAPPQPSGYPVVTVHDIASGSVAGVAVPVNKLALLSPFIGLASLIVVLTAIYLKRVKPRKERL